MKARFIALAAATAIAGSFATLGPAAARDEVKIAGSSTVLPYARIVAEQFQKANPKYKVIVEPGGSSAGIKLFCQGVGPEFIDIANASRAMKPKEVEACAKAGVKDIVQVQFGYDGIVFASNVDGPEFKLEPKDMFLALAPKIAKDGKLIDNPNKTWKQVNAAFPEWDIVAFIPGEKHGTREVFEVKVLEAGCKETGAFDIYQAEAKAAGEDEKAAKKAAGKACMKVRKDDNGNHAVDIDGDYTETLARLNSNKKSIGVFGLAFYENNTDKLRVATVSGVTPSVETVANGEYPVSRPLFFYVKKAHVGVIPGLKEYAEFFVTDKMIGEDGPLAEYGLVPAPKEEADQLRADVKAMKTM